ncbi:MAG TPA: hypothetical protein VFB16_09105 [Bauldia sp.]|nr:hypothetical protein [Bauldia sp.]
MSTDPVEFLEEARSELRKLEEGAHGHYHAILGQLLAAALRETEMLLREEKQFRSWAKAPEETHARVR